MVGGNSDMKIKNILFALFLSCLFFTSSLITRGYAENDIDSEFVEESMKVLNIENRATVPLTSSPLYKPIYNGIKTPISSKFSFQPKATAQTKVSVYKNGREVPHDGKKIMLDKEMITTNPPYIIATNMGVMNGRSIDVKFSLVSAYPSTFFVGLDKNKPTPKESLLTVSDTRSADPQFKLEFIDSISKQPVVMSGNLTIGDIDNGETMVIESVGGSIDSIYSMDNTILNTDSNSNSEKTIIRAQNSADVAESDRRAWVSVSYENANYLLLTYSCAQTGLLFGEHEFEEFDYVEEVDPPAGLATVDILHKNELGEEIAVKEQLQGVVGSLYQSQSKTIPGYKLKETPNNAIGIFSAQTPSVTYIYEKIDDPNKPNEEIVSVRVLYTDLEGREVAPMEILTGTINSLYQAHSKTISGYKLFKEPTNKIGLFAHDNLDIIFIYERDSTIEEPEVGNKAPVIKLAQKEGISDGKDFTVRGIWKDDDSLVVLLMYQINDKPTKLISYNSNLDKGVWQEFSYTIPATEIPIGNHSIKFYAGDAEGLTSPEEILTLTPESKANLQLNFQDEDGTELAESLKIPVNINEKINLTEISELQIILAAIKNQGYELISRPVDDILIENNETTLNFIFKGKVSLVSVTKEMNFESGAIIPIDQRLHYEGAQPFVLNVEDTRGKTKPSEGFKRGQFQISGVLSKPFEHSNGKKLLNAKLVYFDGEMEREISPVGNEIYRSSTARSEKAYEITLSNEAEKELRLEVPKGSGVIQGGYYAEVTWELVQGP